MGRDGMVPWPPVEARRYRARGYWRDRPLGSLPWLWAAEHGDRIALVDGDRRITYRELAELTDVLAWHLLGLGLRAGDNIVVQLPNCWEFVVLTLACFRAGVAPVMALPAHRVSELTAFARHAGAVALVVPDEFRDHDHQGMAAEVAVGCPSVRHILVVGDEVAGGNVSVRSFLDGSGDAEPHRRARGQSQPDPGDIALFLLSGGTSGTPKLIARTHNDYEFNARRSAEVCEFGPDTVYLVVLPAAHNFPLGSPGLLGTLISGGRVVLAPSPVPSVAFGLIEREQVTVTAVVPAVAQRWVEAARAGGRELPSLRVLQVGGAPLAPATAQQAGPALGVTVQQVYGMAEGLLNFTRLADPPEVIHFTQGRPICEDDELRVVDQDGRTVPAGEAGELLTRGPYTPRGYYRAGAHNQRSFADGWYRTGDLVRWHHSGNLVVEGRSKDVINRGGENIAAVEIEDVILRLDQVSEVAVVAVPDAALGERVCACVVLKPGRYLDLDQLRSMFEQAGLAKYKAPEQLELLSELPYTNLGKADKRALREMLADQETRRPAARPRDGALVAGR